MKNLRSLKYLALGLGLMLGGCTPASQDGASQEKQEPLMIFLVRHAEKVDHSRDPDLSKEGYIRAEALAKTLADAGIERIHSSDYIRTRETAAPVADLLGLTTEVYDPSDLESLADKLKSEGGRHLVVGHSNTTPAMVELLGGEAGSPIEDEWEYDRLYIVTLGVRGVQTVLLRYGKPCSSLPNKIKASSLLVPQTSGSALKSEHTGGLSSRP